MISSTLVYFLNTYGVHLLFFGVLGYLWFIENQKEEAVHVVVATAITFVIVLILKSLFDVARPYALDGSDPLAGYFTTGSFPSFHASLSFVVATTVALHQKRVGVVLLVIAALIGFGRIAANVHYPVDVAAGAILGALVAILVEKVHFVPVKRK